MGLIVRSFWRLLLFVTGGLAILAVAAYGAFMEGWWVPLVPPATAWLASAGVITAYMSNREKKHRALLMQLFSRHVSNEVAKAVWNDREQFLDGGQSEV